MFIMFLLKRRNFVKGYFYLGFTAYRRQRGLVEYIIIIIIIIIIIVLFFRDSVLMKATYIVY